MKTSVLRWLWPHLAFDVGTSVPDVHIVHRPEGLYIMTHGTKILVEGSGINVRSVSQEGHVELRNAAE